MPSVVEVTAREEFVRHRSRIDDEDFCREPPGLRSSGGGQWTGEGFFGPSVINRLSDARVGATAPGWSPSAQSRASTPVRSYPRLYGRYLQRTETISRTLNVLPYLVARLTSAPGILDRVLSLQSLNHFQRYAYVRLAAARKAKMTGTQGQSSPPLTNPNCSHLFCCEDTFESE